MIRQNKTTNDTKVITVTLKYNNSFIVFTTWDKKSLHLSYQSTKSSITVWRQNNSGTSTNTTMGSWTHNKTTTMTVTTTIPTTTTMKTITTVVQRHSASGFTYIRIKTWAGENELNCPKLSLFKIKQIVLLTGQLKVNKVISKNWKFSNDVYLKTGRLLFKKMCILMSKNSYHL